MAFKFRLITVRISYWPRVKGFTLIELLIAISILGIIIAIGTAALFGYLQRGRDAKRKADLGAVKTSLESYFQESKAYPTGAGGSPINCSNLGSCTDLAAKLVPTYIKALPKDPKNSGNYVYKYLGTATSFTLTATLENPNDKDCISKPCGPDGYKIESE
ncbi:prepilin-type N-terminal cleavage/methylation domain-containing protein [Candidatus Woesebacteria bacterium]|nr:prepilin-type N-terminal cleavage/methylation domain-containing protein [Candidatus Woesebacteria bacterium]